LATTNVINTLILLPIALYNAERLDLRQASWVRSGLLRRLLLAILVSAALPTLLLGYFLIQQFSLSQQLAATVLVRHPSPPRPSPCRSCSILVSLGFAVANATLVAQPFSRPRLRLSAAAEQMERGSCSREGPSSWRRAKEAMRSVSLTGGSGAWPPR
jgi:hypothetical protein